MSNLTYSTTILPILNNDNLDGDNITDYNLNVTNKSVDLPETYQVSVSRETINIMLISIMVIAVLGIIIGVIFRKDVGGIKTKCCRTRQPELKVQMRPTEEVPLNNTV